jgi:hypothetical protein
MPVDFPNMPLHERIIDIRSGAMSRAWIAFFEKYATAINTIEFLEDETAAITLALMYDTVKTIGFISDNTIPRGDGGKKSLQDSTATIDDSGLLTATSILSNSSITSTTAIINGLITAYSVYVNGEFFNATVAKSADYIVLDDDRVLHIEVTTGATDKIITLPTLADNLDRVLHITKVDAGAGEVIIDGEGTETIAGDLTKTIAYQYTTAQLKAGSSEWLLI